MLAGAFKKLIELVPVFISHFFNLAAPFVRRENVVRPELPLAYPTVGAFRRECITLLKPALKREGSE